MKRAREMEVEMPVDVAAGHTMATWMTPPPAARGHHFRQHAHHQHQHTPARVALFQAGTVRSIAVSISPWKQQHNARANPAHKRCRDRSVPMDALSRMMSAAVTNARMKKHGMAPLFDAAPLQSAQAPASSACCTVCAPMAGRQPSSSVAKCSHCERAVGDCCRRECENCSGTFCSLCSTLNCDEQFDRVFCLSCNYELARS